MNIVAGDVFSHRTHGANLIAGYHTASKKEQVCFQKIWQLLIRKQIG